LLKGGANLRIIETNNGELIVNGIALSPKQSEIVKHDGNIVVSASAGTGKTRTMVSKIVYDLERNKTHKVIAAITFTIKATQEIRERLIVDATHNFIGTNNTFAIEEVIKPFMKDVYGAEYDVDFDADYTNNDHKFDTFDEGIELMKSNSTIYSYRPTTQKSFVFELALDIAKKSKACRLFLVAKYFGVYIDEYQDCDREMHEFFLYLCEKLGIRTFIVGDDKQSIYRWRGAKPELFISVTKNNNFQHFVLTENHRSSISIQNYSNLLFSNTAPLYRKSENKGEIIVVSKDVTDWASVVISALDINKSVALLRSANMNTRNGKGGAKECAEELAKQGLEIVFIPEAPVEQITTTSAWLYMATARFIMLDSFTEYDFIQEVPAEGDMEKKTVNAVKKRLLKIKDTKDDVKEFTASFGSLVEFFNYPTPEDAHINRLIETISDTQYAISINESLPLHSSMTLFKSKGLEFDQVIVFFEDYAHGGNISPDHLNNHYVASTRAKNKLILVSTTHTDAAAFAKKLKTEIFANIEIADLLSPASKAVMQT